LSAIPEFSDLTPAGDRSLPGLSFRSRPRAGILHVFVEPVQHFGSEQRVLADGNVVSVSEMGSPHNAPLEYRAGQQIFFKLEKDVSLETQ
jgi:hypothetical protein